MMRGQAETESSRVEKQAPHQVHQVFVPAPTSVDHQDYRRVIIAPAANA